MRSALSRGQGRKSFYNDPLVNTAPVVNRHFKGASIRQSPKGMFNEVIFGSIDEKHLTYVESIAPWSRLEHKREYILI